MVQLTLAGRSEDGQRLLLVDGDGQEFSVTVDARLRAALQGASRSGPHLDGQLELQMESTLRPRDIQNRIRAGESPETVALAAQTSVDKIMPFAAPVLAERAHIAERAQSASVRRRSGDSGARTLGEAVAAQMRQHNTDPESVEWDAWRREDGRWTLTGLYSAGTSSGVATFSFDMRGNYATLDDDDARWLVGDLAPAAETEPATPADDIAAARARRLSSLPPQAGTEELPLGQDTISMVGGSEAEASAEDTTEIQQVDEPAHAEATEPAQAQEPAARPAKKRGRASVPSWDEIMFGGGKGE